jgi:hypothetical protein
MNCVFDTTEKSAELLTNPVESPVLIWRQSSSTAAVNKLLPKLNELDITGLLTESWIRAYGEVVHTAAHAT